MNGKTFFGIEGKKLKNRLDEIGDARLGGIVLDGNWTIPKGKAEVEKDGTSQTGMIKRECTTHYGKIGRKKKNLAQSGEEAGLPTMLLQQVLGPILPLPNHPVHLRSHQATWQTTILSHCQSASQ